MAHPLGIPRITLADHAQYNDMKAWVLNQNWMPPEFIKRATLYEGITGRKYPVEPLSEEDLNKAVYRKAFNHGLYGKDYTYRRKDD